MEHLLHGSHPNKELIADAELWGVALPEEMTAPVNYSIWPEHLDVVVLFKRCITQWRPGANGVIGMDYGVVMDMGNLYEVPNLPRVMEDLHIMELHARDLINRAVPKEAK